MEDAADPSSRPAVSAEQGTRYFPPGLCSSRPRRHPQSENCALVSPPPDYCSGALPPFFRLPFPHFLIVGKVTDVCAQAFAFFFLTKWPMVCFD